jgi:hypothetical protein
MKKGVIKKIKYENYKKVKDKNINKSKKGFL